MDAEHDKITPALVGEIAAKRDDEEIEVIAELAPIEVPAEGSRRQRAAAMKRDFDAEVAELASTVEDAGGEVVESAWINQTCRLRIPKRSLDEIAGDERVVALDAAREIAGETRGS